MDAPKPCMLISAPRLAAALGVELIIASETFQVTGSFKFRGAYHMVAQTTASHIIVASSGNFGHAIARACQIFGKRCTVVMPDTSARVKIESVQACGGCVDLIDVAATSRADRVTELARSDPHAAVLSGYDDPLMIEGNASLGRELSTLPACCDTILVPVGGGGLSAGIVVGLQTAPRSLRVIGVEPALSGKLTRSVRTGQRVVLEREPFTLADGARLRALGVNTWAVLRDGLSAVVEVSEDAIRESMWLLFALANLKVEPTGALAVAALLATPDAFSGRQVCCVVTGGNVDVDVYVPALVVGRRLARRRCTPR